MNHEMETELKLLMLLRVTNAYCSGLSRRTDDSSEIDQEQAIETFTRLRDRITTRSITKEEVQQEVQLWAGDSPEPANSGSLDEAEALYLSIHESVKKLIRLRTSRL